jgi:TolA-binding protein
MSTEYVPPADFDSEDFWERNKGKLLAYAGVIGLLLASYGIYQYSVIKKTNDSQMLYAKATTEADYQNVIKTYPASVVGGDARLTLADKLRSEGKYDEAVNTLRDFIAKNPKHPLAAGAWTSLGVTYEMQNKPDEALDAYQQGATKYPDAYTTPIAMMAEARIYAQKGKSEDARRVYEDVVSRFPESIFQPQAMRELKYIKK